MTAPTVHKQHGRTFAPAKGSQLMSIQIQHDLLGVAENNLLGLAGPSPHRVEEDQPRQLAAKAR